MERATKNLIQAVDDQRTKRQMSDSKFSKQVLGISPAYFCLLKAGKRPVTGNLAVLLMQKLPEIKPQVDIFIMRQGNDGENQKTVSETAGAKLLGLLGTRKGSNQPQIT